MATQHGMEKATGELFSKLFPAYDDQSFLHSMELLRKRFELNGFDVDWFRGKRCLDAGCGGGRYSMALSLMGASEVVGIDLGKDSIVDARRRSVELGINNVDFSVGSLEKLSFPDGHFDCVVFSGVLQHVARPLLVLKEVSRVVGPGGMLYMLAYATEGVRWPLIQILRPIAQEVGFEAMDKAVVAAGLPVSKRRTYLDDLFVPYIDYYSWQCLEDILLQFGFSSIDRWKGGRLDHEEDIDAYLADISGLLQLFRGAEGVVAGDQSLSCMVKNAEQLCSAAVTYIKDIRDLVLNNKLNSDSAKLILIGQGHHRVVVRK